MDKERRKPGSGQLCLSLTALELLTPSRRSKAAKQQECSRKGTCHIGIHVIWSYGIIALIWTGCKRNDKAQLHKTHGYNQAHRQIVPARGLLWKDEKADQ